MSFTLQVTHTRIYANFHHWNTCKIMFSGSLQVPGLALLSVCVNAALDCTFNALPVI